MIFSDRFIVMTTLRLCFIGDSFVNGTGDPDCLGWTGRVCSAAIQQGHDITYYNLGIRRETSADIASRWYSEMSCRLPANYNAGMVFSFGVNDTTEEEGNLRVNLEDSLKNAYQIITTARQRCPVLMVGIPPITDIEQNRRVAILSQQFYQLCDRLDIPYLDVFTPLEKSTIWMKEVAENDSYHPRSAGYREYAELVQHWQAWIDLLEG